MIEEFNMDPKAECGQLNLAHMTIKSNTILYTQTKYQYKGSNLVNLVMRKQ